MARSVQEAVEADKKKWKKDLARLIAAHIVHAKVSCFCYARLGNVHAKVTTSQPVHATDAGGHIASMAITVHSPIPYFVHIANNAISENLYIGDRGREAPRLRRDPVDRVDQCSVE